MFVKSVSNYVILNINFYGNPFIHIDINCKFIKIILTYKIYVSFRCWKWKEKYDGNYKSDNIVEEGKEHEDINITSGK